MIETSGTYKFQDLRIKSFGEKYLTTAATTVIEETTTVFKKQDVEISDQVLVR